MTRHPIAFHEPEVVVVRVSERQHREGLLRQEIFGQCSSSQFAPQAEQNKYIYGNLPKSVMLRGDQLG